MIYHNKQEFLAAIPQHCERIIGLDIGTKKIGVALGHLTTGISSPLCVISRHNQHKDYLALHKIVQEWNAGGVVAGLPLEMSGQHGSATKMVEDFMKVLLKLGLPIITQDERLSTAAAHSLMRSHSVGRHKRHESDDMIAASLILESFFSSRHNFHQDE